jgi:hypothetical protein
MHFSYEYPKIVSRTSKQEPPGLNPHQKAGVDGLGKMFDEKGRARDNPFPRTLNEEVYR